jgi:hypothetical protein
VIRDRPPAAAEAQKPPLAILLRNLEAVREPV